MNEPQARRAVIAALSAMMCAAASAPVRAEDGGSLTGDWRGESICAADRDVCRDEKALYHLTGPNDRRLVTVVASKIVDGREIVMAPPSDFQYDPEKKTLFLENRYGVFRFTITGTAMEGTLTLPSGVLFRKISLKKDGKPS
jgi:hypothetical protein